jgi:hypothetical protein
VPITDHIHTQCGPGDFAERCDLNRKFPIFSNCHFHQKQKVFTVFSPVETQFFMKINV